MPEDMYVVKLTVEQYAEFAQWLTADVGGGNRRYKRPPGPLSTEIEDKLKSYPATVHERCDPTDTGRAYGNRDKVKAHPDSRSAAANITNMAMPDKICLDKNGNIELEYLRLYVADLCNAPIDDAAWSLLGMYFLSRCK